MFILKLSGERNFTGKLDSSVGLEVKVKVTQSCLTLCDPMDYTVRGILEARILEWIAAPFSRRDLPNPGIEPRSPTLQVEESLPAEPPGKPFIGLLVKYLNSVLKEYAQGIIGVPHIILKCYF